MEHIGLRIKALRKKKDLTQERMAEYLGVSFQAVSKWETGVASPDLSMIVPLARLLDCSADELFGLVDSSADSRRDELRALYMETQQTGDLKERYDISSAAVKEYPGDFEFLYWLGEAQWMYADVFCEKNSDERKLHLQKSIECLMRVIEDCESTEIRNKALHSVVFPLLACGRKDEATQYARQTPDPEFLLLNCLTGEEWLINHQQLIDAKLNEFIMALEYRRNSLKCLKTAEAIIKTIIDDGNYLFYHDRLMHNYIWQAMCLTSEENYVEAIAVLRNSYFHAVEYEKVKVEAQASAVPYTCEIFNKITYDDKVIWRTGISTLVDDFKEYLTWKQFNPIRDREDFKELLCSIEG